MAAILLRNGSKADGTLKVCKGRQNTRRVKRWINSSFEKTWRTIYDLPKKKKTYKKVCKQVRTRIFRNLFVYTIGIKTSKGCSTSLFVYVGWHLHLGWHSRVDKWTPRNLLTFPSFLQPHYSDECFTGNFQKTELNISRVFQHIQQFNALTAAHIAAVYMSMKKKRNSLEQEIDWGCATCTTEVKGKAVQIFLSPY